MQYIHRSFTEKNDRPGKPFEDYIASAGDTFVIADGVTRPAEEYADGTGDSPAARAALLTAECICRFLALSRRRSSWFALQKRRTAWWISISAR